MTIKDNSELRLDTNNFLVSQLSGLKRAKITGTDSIYCPVICICSLNFVGLRDYYNLPYLLTTGVNSDNRKMQKKKLFGRYQCVRFKSFCYMTPV